MRVCIFAGFQPDGIKDFIFDHIKYLKEQLNFNVCYISNCPVSLKDREKLAQFTVNIIVRKTNRGRDFAMYKEGIMHYKAQILKGKVENLLIVNDTIIGPFHNFNTIFNRYNNTEKCDFWGILERGVEGNDKSFICSFFICFKQNVIQSEAFWNYWQRYISFINNRKYIIEFGEKRLSRKLVKAGFNYRAVLEVKDIEAFIKSNSIESLKEDFLQNSQFIKSKFYKKFSEISKPSLEEFYTTGDPFQKFAIICLAHFKVPYIKNYLIARNYIDEETLKEIIQQNYPQIKDVTNFFLR